MKLKHVNLIAGCVDQDAREVKTKFSKTFTTYFFPVGDEVRQIVVEWVAFLREYLLWGNDDPLFPATRIEVGASRHFEAVGLERAHWSSAARIRTIFRAAFTSAGYPHAPQEYPQQASACNTPCWTLENKKAPWIGAFRGVSRTVLDSLKYIFGGVDGRPRNPLATRMNAGFAAKTR